MKRLLVLAGVFLCLTGVTWKAVGPGSGGYNMIVEGPRGVTIACSDAGFLFRSTDRGQSWDPIGKTQNPAVYNRPHTTLVGFSFRTDSAICLVGFDGALARSMDDGLTLESVAVFDSAGITDWPVGVAFSGRGTVSADTVYAGFHTSTSDTVNFRLRRSVISGRIGSWVTMGGVGPTTNSIIIRGTRINKVLCNPNNASIVYLISGYDTFVPHLPDLGIQGAVNFRVWQSRNAGVSFRAIAGPGVSGMAAGDSIVDFMINPLKPDTVFATTWTGIVDNNKHAGKVWIRTGIKADVPGTWTLLAPGTADSITGTLLYTTRASGASDPVLYVCDTNRDSPGTRTGVFKAVSPYTTWTQLDDGTNQDKGWVSFLKGSYGVGFRGWMNSITTSLYGGQAFWRGTSQFAYKADSTGRFVSVQTKKTDQPGWGPIGTGKEWWKQTGIDGSVPMSITAHGNWVYIGAYDQGISRSNDGGLSWQQSNDTLLTGSWLGGGGDCSTILADPDNATVWACQGSGKTSNHILRSTNHGEPGSWVADVGIPAALLSGLALDPFSPPGTRTLYVCATGDLYKSVDDGVNWSLIWDTTDSLRQVAAYNREVWVGGSTGLWRATDGAINSGSFTRINPIAAGWTTLISGSNFEFRYRGIQKILMYPDGRRFIVVHGNGTGTFGVYVNPNGTAIGVNDPWNQIHTGAHDRDFLIGPNGEYYIASSSHTSSSGLQGGLGIIRSKDQGATWKNISAKDNIVDVGNGNPIGLGIPSTNVGWLVLDPRYGEWLIAAAPGSGCWRTELPSKAFAPRVRR